jgi:eukaryotic-like serine/threonine-protein kinase
MHPGDVVVGRFVAEERVAVGGGGVVWRALDRLTGRHVALKLVGPEDADTLDRFRTEVAALETLHHPAIVRYVAHGVTDRGERFLVAEWLDGETLSDRLSRGAIALHDAVILARRVAEALAVVHARRIVHRDVKPGNVFLRGGEIERATLLDFGVARMGMNAQLTRPGMVIGTPSYMSPEQAVGAVEVDARADVFALGCVLFRCLTGRTPFGTGDALAVLSKIVLQPAPPVRELAPEVPRPLERLVARMLAKDPAERPADGAAVAAELAGLESTPSVPSVPVAPPSRPDALTQDEQGIVSIVLVSSPASDPGEATTIRSMSQRPPDELDAGATAFGGRFERLLDGTCVVVLSGRGNAADQAGLAARFGLAARRMPQSGAVVLATGRGVLSDRALVGDAIDRAVELLRRARASGSANTDVLIDTTSRALLESRFDVVSRDADSRLIGEGARDEPVRTFLGRPTPCVGRERELAMLGRILDECFDEPRARAVLMTGPSGAGKSRLRYELFRSLGHRRNPDVWVGRGDPVGAGSPFGLLGRAIRRAVGIREGERAEQSRRKLELRVARGVAQVERVRVTEFLGEIVGVAFPEAASEPLRAARRDRGLMMDQIRDAWETWIAAECDDRGLLLVLEDLHWGDAPSVDLVDTALRVLRDRPFMVLALARPEVTDLFASPWSERDVEYVRLAPLGKRAADALVRTTLPDADDGTVARIIERAAGNALYLEELIRAFAEGHSHELPETVLAMVQARLEKFEPELRRVLRAASVFGTTFWEGGVRALVGAEADVFPSLEALVHREVLDPRRESRLTGEREYVFRHSVVREGAYAMLTNADRALGHQLAGGWLESKGERDAALLADHFEHAGDRGRAIAWNVRAAQQALDAHDVTAALARVARGEASGAAGVDLGRLRAVASSARGWVGQSREAAALGTEAMQLLPYGHVEWCRAAGECVREAGRVGDLTLVERTADALVALPDEDESRHARIIALAGVAIRLHMSGHGERASAVARVIEGSSAQIRDEDPLLAGQLETVRLFEAVAADDFPGQFRHLEAAVRAFEQAGALRNTCASLSDLGNSYMLLGRWEEAERVLRDVLATCDRIGLVAIAPGVRANLAYVLERRGRLAEALPLALEALAALSPGSNTRTEGGVRIYLARIRARMGDLDGAARDAAAAHDLFGVAPPLRPFALAVLADVELRRGKIDAGLSAAREAIDALEEVGRVPEGEGIVRLVWAEALDAAGRRAEAEAAIASANEALERRAARLKDPESRAHFLDIAEHRRTLELARAWSARPA